MGAVRALYVHVPFCVRRCRYCDFATEATGRTNPLLDTYVESILNLMDEVEGLGLLEGLLTAYVGGGTPSLLGAERLGRLLGRVACGRGLGELSFEANPESLTGEVLAAAREAGATRVSVGVQSFDDAELLGLGRVHTAQVARDRVAAAVASGLRTSVDLMCGIPYQTPVSWGASLRKALGLGVGHVSCYPLMIEPGTPMERMCEKGELPWPSDDVEADVMESAARLLGQAGFSRYEVASYALPGQECRHNVAYWTGAEYLGLGTAAAGMLGRASYARLREAVPELPAPEPEAARFRISVGSSTAEVAAARRLTDLAFDVEQMCAREAAAEDLMLGMRMTRGVSQDLLASAAQSIPQATLDQTVERSLSLGLTAWQNNSLVPTQRGWLMGNELYGLFWDLAE